MTPVWPDSYITQRQFVFDYRKRLELIERKVRVGTVIQNTQPTPAQLQSGWNQTINNGQVSQIPEGGKVQWFDPVRESIRTAFVRLGDWGLPIDGQLIDIINRPTYSFSSIFGTDVLEVAADQINVTIPQTHKDFLVFFKLRTTQAVATASCSLRVNGNSGGVYSASNLRTDSAGSAGVEILTGTEFGLTIPGASSLRHQYATGFLWFPRYQSTKRPALWGMYSFFRNSPIAAADKFKREVFCSINTAAAITSLQILSGASGDFEKGSSYLVLGIN